jgi:hypothetical protein
MNVYRITRDFQHNFPAGTLLAAVVVAPSKDLARGMGAVLEPDRALAEAWLDPARADVLEIGTTSQEYDDGLSLGDGVPHVLLTDKVQGASRG